MLCNLASALLDAKLLAEAGPHLQRFLELGIADSRRERSPQFSELKAHHLFACAFTAGGDYEAAALSFRNILRLVEVKPSPTP